MIPFFVLLSGFLAFRGAGSAGAVALNRWRPALRPPTRSGKSRIGSFTSPQEPALPGDFRTQAIVQRVVEREELAQLGAQSPLDFRPQ